MLAMNAAVPPIKRDLLFLYSYFQSSSEKGIIYRVYYISNKILIINKKPGDSPGF